MNMLKQRHGILRLLRKKDCEKLAISIKLLQLCTNKKY